MSDEQILRAAMKKAVANGYDPTKRLHTYDNYRELIFSHDFAKAFWPNFPWYYDEWKDRLQEMVLDLNPLHYLKQFLPTTGKDD